MEELLIVELELTNLRPGFSIPCSATAGKLGQRPYVGVKVPGLLKRNASGFLLPLLLKGSGQVVVCLRARRVKLNGCLESFDSSIQFTFFQSRDAGVGGEHACLHI